MPDDSPPAADERSRRCGRRTRLHHGRRARRRAARVPALAARAHRHRHDQRRRPQAPDRVGRRRARPKSSKTWWIPLPERASHARSSASGSSPTPASDGWPRRRRSAGPRSPRASAQHCRQGCARTAGGFIAAALVGRRVPARSGVAGARREAAAHRRALGLPRPRRRRAGVDRHGCEPARPPIPLRWRRTFRPRSIASTCRPTSPPSRRGRWLRTSI